MERVRRYEYFLSCVFFAKRFFGWIFYSGILGPGGTVSGDSILEPGDDISDRSNIRI